MPIFHVLALPQNADVNPTAVLKDLCRGLAEHLGVDERQVWGTWDGLPAGRYVEGGRDEDTQPHGTHPPLVRIMAFEGRSDAQIEGVLTRAAEILGDRLGIDPGNVFVHYEELRSGRVLAGGKVLKK